MKHLITTALTTSLLTINSWALACNAQACNQNVVTLPISAQTWVKSPTAKVIIELNASIKDQQVLHLPSQLQNTLHKLADQEWHVTHFDKDTDKSGLNKIVIDAQTRLDNEALLKLKKQLKNVSQAGMTYHLKKVDYEPSHQQLKNNRAQLRQSIYHQAHQEAQRLQKTYSNKKIHVQSINFVPGLMQKGGHRPNPRQLKMVRLAGGHNEAQQQSSSPTFPISQRLKQKAIVKISLLS